MLDDGFWEERHLFSLNLLHQLQLQIRNAKVNFIHNVCLFILRFVLSINFKFASEFERKNLNPVNYIDSLEHKRVETLLL